MAAVKIAPWVSASLSELQPGHTGEYEKTANDFLDLVITYVDSLHETNT